MNPTGCPRCVAERRAPCVRLGMVTTATLSFGLLALGVWMLDRMMSLPVSPVEPGVEVATMMMQSGGAISLVAGALHLLIGHLTRRASTPLLAPAADPLATYRDGPPVECPRHPFAR